MKKRNWLLTLLLSLFLCLFGGIFFAACGDGGGGAGGTGIAFLTFSVDGTDVSGKVSNDTEEFSFPREIIANGNSKYIVSWDEYGENTLASKTIPLSVGDNKVYVIEMVNDEPIKVYKVTIRRNAIYTVTFNTDGGTAVKQQKVEEGDKATFPNAPTRVGYAFESWDYNFSLPITKDTTINVVWKANTDTKYTVEYYFENLNDTNYTLSERVRLSGKTDTVATAEIHSHEGFVFNQEQSTEKGNIDGDGSRVLKVYYSRRRFTLSSGDENTGKVVGAGAYKQGSEGFVATAKPNIGCKFVGWYSGDELVSREESYLFTVDKDVTAKFIVKPEMELFEFVSTATTCMITGVKDATVTEIVVPDYVTQIEKSAFLGCNALTEMTLPFLGEAKDDLTNGHFGYIFGAKSSAYHDQYVPESIKSVTVLGGSVGAYAFYRCDGLTSVTLGEKVASINADAFRATKSLTTIEIGENVTSIGSYAFYECKGLTSIVIPGGVETISESAFGYCAALTDLTIKDGVKVIENSVFSNCTALQAVNIPDSVVSIGASAFYDCQKMTSLSIGSGVESIGAGAFYGCSSLKRVTIPDGVTSLGERAFEYCRQLSSVTIGNDIRSIERRTFLHCSSIVDIVLPDNLTFIGYEAFAYCGKLESVVFSKEMMVIEEYAFYECKALTDVALPDKVTSIGDRAFSSCEGLTSIIIPESMKVVARDAFWNCYALTIYCKGKSQPSGWEDRWHNGNPVVWDCDNNDLATDGYLYVVIDGVRYQLKDGEAVVCRQPKNLTNVTIIQNVVYDDETYVVTTIAQGAFRMQGFLVEIALPDTLTTIEGGAFSFCEKLVEIEIPASVTTMEEGAFSACYDLTIYCQANSQPTTWVQYWNDECPVVWDCENNDVADDGYMYTYVNGVRYKIKDGKAIFCKRFTFEPTLVIPESVVYNGETYNVSTIKYNAFLNDEQLTVIVIPKSITEIQMHVCGGCYHLTSIYYEGTKFDWNKIKFGDYNDNIKDATRYYYSETQPLSSGDYWHYDENGEIVIW